MPSASLNHLAVSATVHCLTGCAIGEALGLVIGDALGWGNTASIALAVALAFSSGEAWPKPGVGISVKATTRAAAVITIAIWADFFIRNLLFSAQRTTRAALYA